MVSECAMVTACGYFDKLNSVSLFVHFLGNVENLRVLLPECEVNM